MQSSQLILREITYRKTNFILALFAVALPVAMVVGSAGLFGRYTQSSEQVMEESTVSSGERWSQYQDRMRKTMKRLGFNLLILPEEHTISDPDAEKLVMPESYAKTLANHKLELVNHVLPYLERRYYWEERDRWVRLFGTEGEVYIRASWQAPLQESIARGTIALGYNIHKALGLSPGDNVVLAGKTFRVGTCYPPRSVEDDERVWMHVREAQTIFDEEGNISGMLALACNCADKDIPLIDEAIKKILPGTKVLAETSALSARNTARTDARNKAQTEIALQKQEHGVLRGQRELLEQFLIPLVLCGSFFTVGLLSWLNVRERRSEIGIFRAIGYPRTRILNIFIGKALLLGIAGGVMGICVALAVVVSQEGPSTVSTLGGVVLLTLAVAPLLTILATLFPAALAAAQDPVEVLRDE